jgi:acetylglutamate kinase
MVTGLKTSGECLIVIYGAGCSIEYIYIKQRYSIPRHKILNNTKVFSISQYVSVSRVNITKILTSEASTEICSV